MYLEDNKLRISGLPYGTFLLKIRAQGESGQFSTQTLALPIQVLRPFYLQWWFLVLVLASLFLGIRYWLKYRTQFLVKQQNYLEEQIKERTKTIAAQTEELKSLDEMKSRFFANISHELRTPLTLMLAPIDDALRENHLTNRTHTNLLMAQRNGNRLKRLINEILDLAKLESSQLEVRNTTIVLYDYLKVLIANFESLANVKGIQFKFNYKGDKELQVELDKGKLEIILLNLLSNAFKFTLP
ncbi:MAG: HAMP domain-containing sensor histidine kinase, partial [Cyanobacteria bacterium P01_A01_bin.84]